MEAFADVVRAGKALYIGVSEWTPAQLRAGHALARELRIPFISNQSKYNALFRVIEPYVVPTCRELGIGQICFSPIEQGVLTGKYQAGEPVPAGSRATDEQGADFIKDLLTEDLLTRIQRLGPLAEAEGLTMAQMAVAWVLNNDNVASAITGGSRPEQVKDNASAAGKSLSPETIAGIDEALGDKVERDGSLWDTRRPRTGRHEPRWVTASRRSSRRRRGATLLPPFLTSR